MVDNLCYIMSPCYVGIVLYRNFEVIYLDISCSFQIVSHHHVGLHVGKCLSSPYSFVFTFILNTSFAIIEVLSG